MGCRRVAPQQEMVRVVRFADASVALGRTLPGRGAWLCAGSVSCLDAAVKRHAFARALRGPVDRASVVRLRAEVAAGLPQQH